VIGAQRAGEIDIGSGTLTVNGNIQVFAIGTGRPEGARIENGTLALQVFEASAAAGQRTWQVEHMALSAMIRPLPPPWWTALACSRSGFSRPASELGALLVRPRTHSPACPRFAEGELALDKTAGVNALGQIIVGDATVTSGFAKSVRPYVAKIQPASGFHGRVPQLHPWDARGQLSGALRLMWLPQVRSISTGSMRSSVRATPKTR